MIDSEKLKDAFKEQFSEAYNLLNEEQIMNIIDSLSEEVKLPSEDESKFEMNQELNY